MTNQTWQSEAIEHLRSEAAAGRGLFIEAEDEMPTLAEFSKIMGTEPEYVECDYCQQVVRNNDTHDC